jgi:hypothetical protein
MVTGFPQGAPGASIDWARSTSFLIQSESKLRFTPPTGRTCCTRQIYKKLRHCPDTLPDCGQPGTTGPSPPCAREGGSFTKTGDATICPSGASLQVVTKRDADAMLTSRARTGRAAPVQYQDGRFAFSDDNRSSRGIIPYGDLAAD